MQLPQPPHLLVSPVRPWIKGSRNFLLIWQIVAWCQAPHDSLWMSSTVVSACDRYCPLFYTKNTSRLSRLTFGVLHPIASLTRDIFLRSKGNAVVSFTTSWNFSAGNRTVFVAVVLKSFVSFSLSLSLIVAFASRSRFLLSKNSEKIQTMALCHCFFFLLSILWSYRLYRYYWKKKWIKTSYFYDVLF